MSIGLREARDSAAFRPVLLTGVMHVCRSLLASSNALHGRAASLMTIDILSYRLRGSELCAVDSGGARLWRRWARDGMKLKGRNLLLGDSFVVRVWII